VERALRVRGREAVAQLPADVGHLLRRQMARVPQQRRRVLALHQLHRIEHPMLGLADVEHAADCRVGDPAREPDLFENPGPALGDR
jgi:hypothetical protein